MSMKYLLVSNDLDVQSKLMNAEEAFYIARNFEYDFKRRVSEDDFETFFEYWETKGNITYGFFSNIFENQCIQTEQSFGDFLDSALLKREDYIMFSPIGPQKTCVVLEIHYKDFKTYGVITSLKCIGKSSPLFSC